MSSTECYILPGCVGAKLPPPSVATLIPCLSLLSTDSLFVVRSRPIVFSASVFVLQKTDSASSGEFGGNGWTNSDALRVPPRAHSRTQMNGSCAWTSHTLITMQSPVPTIAITSVVLIIIMHVNKPGIPVESVLEIGMKSGKVNPLPLLERR